MVPFILLACTKEVFFLLTKLKGVYALALDHSTVNTIELLNTEIRDNEWFLLYYRSVLRKDFFLLTKLKGVYALTLDHSKLYSKYCK